jgi:hypothetical protein
MSLDATITAIARGRPLDGTVVAVTSVGKSTTAR